MSHVPAGVLDLAEAEAALTWPDAPQMPPSLAMPPPLAGHAESHLFTQKHNPGPKTHKHRPLHTTRSVEQVRQRLANTDRRPPLARRCGRRGLRRAAGTACRRHVRDMSETCPIGSGEQQTVSSGVGNVQGETERESPRVAEICEPTR